jgi:hypothetical protein
MAIYSFYLFVVVENQRLKAMVGDNIDQPEVSLLFVVATGTYLL